MLPYDNKNVTQNSDKKIMVSSKQELFTFNIFPLGLDIDTCHIIEMACLITDENLNIVAEVNCKMF